VGEYLRDALRFLEKVGVAGMGEVAGGEDVCVTLNNS
jgi:hypothetical protein